MSWQNLISLNTLADHAKLENLVGTIRDMVWVPGSAMDSQETTGPSTYGTVTSNGVTINGIAFDPSTPEYAQIFIAMPKGWNRGTISGQFDCLTTHDPGKTVAHTLQAMALSSGDAVNNTFGQVGMVWGTLTNTMTLYTTSETAPVVVSNSPASEDLVKIRVGRDPLNDSLAVDSVLIGLRLYMDVNTLDGR